MAKKVGYQNKSFSWRTESRFKEAKQYAHDSLATAIQNGVQAGYVQAETILAKHEGSDPVHIADELTTEVHTNFGSLWGALIAPTWYARFVEYGTVRTFPIPFMRPAHRKMKLAFTKTLGIQMAKQFTTSRFRGSSHRRGRR